MVIPSDHTVIHEDRFSDNMLRGMDMVDSFDHILTMGVKPTRPETGYGYIQKGDPTDTEHIYKVKSFTEKPDAEFAKLFMESGEFLWNTGLLFANARYLHDCFRKLFPEVLNQFDTSSFNYTIEQEMAFVNDNYPSYPKLSIDQCVLERGSNVYVMTCDFGWADLGTWHSIYESMSKGDGDNVVIDSEVMLEDAHNNVIKLPKGKLGVINGLDGYIVAEEGNVLFICKKGDSSAMVRKYVSEVQIKYGDDFV